MLCVLTVLDTTEFCPQYNQMLNRLQPLTAMVETFLDQDWVSDLEKNPLLLPKGLQRVKTSCVKIDGFPNTMDRIITEIVGMME